MKKGTLQENMILKVATKENLMAAAQSQKATALKLDLTTLDTNATALLKRSATKASGVLLKKAPGGTIFPTVKRVMYAERFSAKKEAAQAVGTSAEAATNAKAADVVKVFAENI